MKGEDGGGTLGDPYLHNIRDSSGTAISNTGNDDVDAENDIYDSQITFTPTTAGAYYLVAAGAASTGTYTLSVREVPCTLNEGDFWCGVVTVGEYVSGGSTLGHGFLGTTGDIDGNPDDKDFTVPSNNNEYTITTLLVGAGSARGSLVLQLDEDLMDTTTTDDQATLELGIDGESDLFPLSAATTVGNGGYRWDGTGLDWSTESTVTVRLREGDPPTLSVADAAGDEGDDKVVFTVTLSSPIPADVVKLAADPTAKGTINDDDAADEASPSSTPGFGEGLADLLSNLGQATDANSFAGIRTYDSAQGFTTGGERNGYFLDSITLDVKTVPKTPADVTVELWSASSGNPDASIATLTHATGNWATGLNTFSAPPGKVLAAETKYFVVVSYSGDQPGLDLKSTRTASADDASTNWTVTGKRLERLSDNDGSWAGVSATEYLKFRVRAAAVPGQVAAEGDTDLPANATTNGVLVADGYAARGAIAEPVEVTHTVTDDDDNETEHIRYAFDTDWLAVDLKAGRTYRIDMKGATPGDDELTLRLPEIEAIYDADSNYLPNTSSRDATDDANSSHHLARVEFTPHADGTYYIAATGESFTWGVYELTVIDITRDADEHPADRSTTEHAQRGTPVTGKIDFSGDVDWFQLNKTVADTYQIDLEGQATGRGSLRDPLLRGVYDADGNYISGTRNDDGGEGYNARITLDLPVGIYYIAVGAFGNHEGTYTLSVNYS